MSTPPTETSTRQSRYRDDPIDEQRNDEVTDNDTAPLLNGERDERAHVSEQKFSIEKKIRFLTAFTLTLSILAAILLVVLRILTIKLDWRDFELYWAARAGSRATTSLAFRTINQQHHCSSIYSSISWSDYS